MLLLLLCAQGPAWAQAFKCKQPNGSMSFQDHPCASDAPGTNLSLQPLNNGATEAYGQSNGPTNGGSAPRRNRAAESLQERQADAERKAYEDKVKANNEQTMAYNRKLMCDAARRQLDVLKKPVRVYTRDNNGDKQYVSDDNRPAEIAAAQKRVNDSCN